jgi:catechol 2,3-dioxygenase-like lactoylglutathione lyase family enzyme
MVKIRHIAFKSHNPARLAKFYSETLGLKIIHQQGTGFYLSDGYLTVALLQSRPEDSPPGFNHFGITVEDADAVGDAIVAHGLPKPTERPAKTPYAERRGMDPDGNLFDISEHGYEKVEHPPERAAKKVSVPAE